VLCIHTSVFAAILTRQNYTLCLTGAARLLGRSRGNASEVPEKLLNLMAAKVLSFPRTSRADRAKLEERAALVAAKADQSAVWGLADFYLPLGVRNYLVLLCNPKVATGIWRSAFVAGWQAAERAKGVKEP
jgi:hypothetical protein